MKNFFVLFILFIIVQTGFTQGTVQLTCFDNLRVTVNIIKDTEYTSEKYEQGWSLTFSEKNKLFQMVITLYPFDKDTFKMEEIKKELAAEGTKLLVQSEEKEIVINDYLNKPE